MPEYTMMVHDPSGDQDYSLQRFFAGRLADAQAAFDTDDDDIPPTKGEE